MISILKAAVFCLIIFSLSDCAEVKEEVSTVNGQYLDDVVAGDNKVEAFGQRDAERPPTAMPEEREVLQGEAEVEDEELLYVDPSDRPKRLSLCDHTSFTNASCPLHVKILYANKPKVDDPLRDFQLPLEPSQLKKSKRKIGKRERKHLIETPFQLRRGDEVCFNGVRIQAEGEDAAGQLSVLSSVQRPKEKELFGSWTGNLTVGLKLGDETYVLVGKKDETSELLNAEKSAALMENVLNDNDVSRYKKSTGYSDPGMDAGFHSSQIEDIHNLPERLRKEITKIRSARHGRPRKHKKHPHSRRYATNFYQLKKPSITRQFLSSYLPSGDRTFGAMDFPPAYREIGDQQGNYFFKKNPFLKPDLNSEPDKGVWGPSDLKAKWGPSGRQQYFPEGMIPPELSDGDMAPRVSAWEEKVGGDIEANIGSKDFSYDNVHSSEESKTSLNIDPGVYEPDITRKLMGDSDALNALMSPDLEVESFHPKAGGMLAEAPNEYRTFQKRRVYPRPPFSANGRLPVFSPPVNVYQDTLNDPEGIPYKENDGNSGERKSRGLSSGSTGRHSAGNTKVWGNVVFNGLAKEKSIKYGYHRKPKSDWMKPFILNVPFDKGDAHAQGEGRSLKSANGITH